MGVDRDQAFVEFAQVVRIVARLAFRHQRRSLCIGGEHGFERAGLSARRLLRDIAKPAATRHRHRTGIRLQHPRNDAHERGLARTIAPDQANAAARGQLGGRFVDDRASAQAYGNVGQVQHGARLAAARAGRKSSGAFGDYLSRGLRTAFAQK
jgi:hypothetical protein